MSEEANWRETLACELVDYRHCHGLSQRALARQLGLPHSTVTRLELGEHEPRVSTLCVLADILEKDLILQIRPGEPVQLRDLAANPTSPTGRLELRSMQV